MSNPPEITARRRALGLCVYDLRPIPAARHRILGTAIAACPLQLGRHGHRLPSSSGPRPPASPGGAPAARASLAGRRRNALRGSLYALRSTPCTSPVSPSRCCGADGSVGDLRGRCASASPWASPTSASGAVAFRLSLRAGGRAPPHAGGRAASHRGGIGPAALALEPHFLLNTPQRHRRPDDRGPGRGEAPARLARRSAARFAPRPGRAAAAGRAARLAASYAGIFEERHKGRLAFHWEVGDGPRSVLLPRLLAAALGRETPVKHGALGRADGGQHRSADQIWARASWCHRPGQWLGIPGEARDGRLGLHAVQRKLALQYAETGELPHGVVAQGRVDVEIPARGDRLMTRCARRRRDEWPAQLPGVAHPRATGRRWCRRRPGRARAGAAGCP